MENNLFRLIMETNHHTLKSDHDNEEIHEFSFEKLRDLVLPKMKAGKTEKNQVQQQKNLAETIFKYVFDQKSKTLSKLGKKIC